jgi:hypothetical protein
MTREEIRTYIRTLANELTEAPEGLFTNVDLNPLINISQRNVQLDLMLSGLVWYFRKSGLISITKDKSTYSITTDLSITDLLLIEEILFNVEDEYKNPVPKIDIDQTWEFELEDSTDPIAWGREDKDTIFVMPKPTTSISNYWKIYYFKRIPALNHDTSDVTPNIATPHLPEEAHPLIALDVLKDWMIRDDEAMTQILLRYEECKKKVVDIYSMAEGMEIRQRISKEEITKLRGDIYY